jgi:hypothetical protein
MVLEGGCHGAVSVTVAARRLRIRPVSDHIPGMANLAPIKVLFVCQGCGLTYMAIQERLKGAGRFDCTECRHPVYEWSGPTITPFGFP